MDLEQNKQTALAMLQAIGAADGKAAGELMTPDATWWVVGQGARENASPRGPFLEALAGRMGQLFASPVRFTVQGITAQGDRVALEADSEAELVNGKTYRNMYHFLFIFGDGKIQQVREYNDTAYMRATFA